MHFSDPTVDSTVGDLCSVLAKQNMSAIEQQAQMRGVSVDDVLSVFVAACQLRMKEGVVPARTAGLMAARGEPPQ